MKLLSIVVPCYNEQEVLPLFYDKITEVMDGMKTENPELDYELVFINDGSRDATLEGLKQLKTVEEVAKLRGLSKEEILG